ncbi:MAG TPA: hypothetical protein VJP40_04025 [bacterium]|nr:hypothetical protein [bacterium]
MKALVSTTAMKTGVIENEAVEKKIRGRVMNKRCVFILGISLMTVVGCQRQSNPEGAMTTAPVSVVDQKTQIAKEGGDYSFGNPSCDAFVKKYEDCVKNVGPGEEREKYRVLFEKTVEELGKAQAGALPYSLEEACSRREQEAKSLLVAKSCSW